LERGAGLEPAPTLSEIVRPFKTFSSRRINKLRDNSGILVWQLNYYERVIRDEKELAAIREYIHTNPMKWDLGKNNPKNMNAL
jgi:REP-associated tyrosine transposase